MNKIDEIDFEMFWRLSSLYHAVTLSATSPVVLPTSGSKMISSFSHAFYDTFDNEGKAIREIWGRIKSGSNEIRDHYLLHSKMRDGFYSVEESTNTNNRNRLVNDVVDLYNGLIDYVKIVNYHQENLRENSFLFYPTCVRGHYFMVSWDNKFRASR